MGLYYLTQSPCPIPQAPKCVSAPTVWQNRTDQTYYFSNGYEHSRNYEQFTNLGHTDDVSSIIAEGIISRHHIDKDNATASDEQLDRLV